MIGGRGDAKAPPTPPPCKFPPMPNSVPDPTLERFLALQLARIRQRLHPTPHSLGTRKPDLQEQEARLMGEVEQEDDE